MNSLLQTLCHIPYFRKAVYHMPTTNNDMPSGSIPLALQSLFYKLQYNDRSVGTKGLTKSFGWDTRDSFMQHDVEEFNRVFCERLEGKMKGTRVEGTIQHLFEGHIKNYIEVLDVDYESTRKESFYDLQLDVKGCRDVYASFDKYIEVEKLDGDNKYHAEQHGLQNAEKGILFLDFPPVLQLHLKRFEYDFIRNSNAKINDRYEFPLQLDLDIDGGKYLSPEADRRVRNLYTLHSVLVHSGGVHGGHYYAFIRPTLSDKWFRFDDERVTREGLKMALEEQYGGEQELPQTNPGSNNTTLKFTKSSNAYMLVYIRESDKENIICDVDEKDIAQHLRVRLNKEQEEKEHKKKEKADAHLYTTIKVTRDCDLAQQIGRDIFFDLVDQERVHNFCALKDTPFRLFKVGEMQDRLFREQFTEMKFFVEVEVGQDSYPILPSEKTEDDFLLFFKFYNPEKEELRYVGKLIVKNIGKPIEILEKLNEMAGLPENEEIDLYEEVRFEPDVMCTPLDKEDTFHSHQLEDGDIICYQKSSSLMSDEQIRYLDVPSFLKYIRNRQVVCFRSMEKPKDEDFYLELSKKFTYEDIVDSVAAQLGLDDPSKIRLTPHNSRLDMPKNQPIKYRSVDTLLAMLVTNGQISDILYYEVLDIPLPELQCCQSLKIVYHHAIHDEAIVHAIRLPQSSTVVDIINNLKTKIHIYHPNAEFRLVEIFYHKIYKIFSPSEKIENINDQNWTLRFEEIPEEEKYMGPNDRLVHIYHFRKKPNQMMTIENFGNPFLFAMRSDETLSEIKIRIQKRLHISDEEFSKWRFAFCALGRAEYLEDDDIVLSRFQNRDVYGPWEQYLGLEHSNTAAPMKIHNAQQNENILQPYVKPVKIQ